MCVCVCISVLCVYIITYIHVYISSTACPRHPPESSLTPLIHIYKSYHDLQIRQIPAADSSSLRRFLHQTPPLRRQLRAPACANPSAAAAGMQHSSSSRKESQVIHASVCVCLCIYIYISIHTYVRIYIHTYIHTYVTTDAMYSLPSSSARNIFDTIQRR